MAMQRFNEIRSYGHVVAFVKSLCLLGIPAATKSYQLQTVTSITVAEAGFIPGPCYAVASGLHKVRIYPQFSLSREMSDGLPSVKQVKRPRR